MTYCRLQASLPEKKMFSIIEVPPENIALTYPPSLDGVNAHDEIGDDDWIFYGMVRARDLAETSDPPMQK